VFAIVSSFEVIATLGRTYSRSQITDIVRLMSDSPQVQRIRMAKEMQMVYKERVRRRLAHDVWEVDSMMEQVATYLQDHHIATSEQICEAVGLDLRSVVGSLHRLKERGIVGSLEYGETDRYFLR
jgi:transcription initiation factor IIE alpha subunit